MINKFNIISGERATWRSTLLLDISKVFAESGSKVCFIGGTEEFNNTQQLYTLSNLFEYYTFNKNDIGTFQIIFEMEDKFDILVIDDIDYIDKYFHPTIFLINKPIICTCLSDADILKMPFTLSDSSKIFNIVDNSTIEFDNTKMGIKDFVKQLQRELKLNSLLDEE